MTIPPPLHQQHPTPAPAADKARLSLLATALVDALGGPVEFQSRFSFEFVTEMRPNENFDVGEGVWTDDTSMALCLAKSLATFSAIDHTVTSAKDIHDYLKKYIEREDAILYKTEKTYREQERGLGGFNEQHQLALYTAWARYGFLSATGYCFDIGNTTSRALGIYENHGPATALEHINERLSDARSSGNGSLMRVIPIGITYWRDESLARQLARRSSVTTHPSPLCLEACEVWTGAVVRIIQNCEKGKEGFSKLDILDYFATFPYTTPELRKAFYVLQDAPARPMDSHADLEAYYYLHHPLLKLATATQKAEPANSSFGFSLPSEQELPSTGYVLHTIVAALYCFLATATFEDGALMAVNLGSDADTVGAIYGGLAGCWYAAEKGKGGEGVFWTSRVKRWQTKLAKKEIIESVAEELVIYSASLQVGESSL